MRIALVLCLASLAACTHQFLAIPGTSVVNEHAGPGVATDQAPSASVTSGQAAMAAGDEMTVHIDFGAITEIEVTQIAIWTGVADAIYAHEWIRTLTPEEQDAGAIDLSLFVLADRPEQGFCPVDYRGKRTHCIGEIDQGTAFVSFRAQNDAGASMGAPIDFQVAPLTPADEPVECAAYTFDTCCSGAGTIECYLVESACSCPAGTADGGLVSDGARRCTCPG
jgi:hypothetical protein